MIDLHSHTTASDGTSTPAELVAEAKRAGLEAISITDHDTFDAYGEAAPAAAAAGLTLLTGIEVSTKLSQPGRPHPKTVHLLGYFFKGPSEEFRAWIQSLAEARHQRNVELAARLQSLGLEVTIDEVRALGRNMAGRPHFARLLVDKGYVTDLQEAFDKYLDEKGAAYVEKQDPSLAEALRRVRDGGGIPSLAHPIRLNRPAPIEEDLIRQMAKMGLLAIEAYHSDHNERAQERYQFLARRYNLAITGGSDFHGANKPGVELGSGRDGNVSVPTRVLDRLRMLVR